MRIRLTAALSFFLLALPCFAAVTGTVMTTDGTPVAGAKLTLLPFEPTDARAARLLAGAPGPEALASGTSDAKGNFSLQTTTAAMADLRIEATGLEPQTIRVERDDELGAIALRKAAAREGRITANGKPVANARVIWWSTTSQILAQATTDGEGRYVVPDPRNAAGLSVLHPDFAMIAEMFPRMPAESTTKLMDRALQPGKPITGRVVAADGETPVAKATILVDGWPLATSADDGTFTVPHARDKWKSLVALSGGSMAVRRGPADGALTLRLGKAPVLRGTARDSKTQQPLANVEVRLSSQESILGTAVLTDAKGNYSRSDVPAGAYRLSFLHPAYAAEFSEAAVAATGTSTKDARMTAMARVSGTVMDEEKRAVAGASLSPEEVTGEGMPRFFRPTTATYSGPDGRFLMRVLGDQEIKVRAIKKGFPEAKSDPVRLAPAERKRGVTIVIPSGIAVSGRVTDRDGNPLSGVAVGASESENSNGGPMRRMIVLNVSSDDEQVVRTGSDGTFTTRLREGTYDFTFRREGYAAKSVRAHAVTIGAQPVEASLEPSVEIRGRVTRSGAGIEGVSVSSFSADQQSTTITATDGSFTLADLAPGPTRLSLRKEDELIMEQRNVTAPGRDVIIDLPPGGKVSGRVVDKASHKPVTAFQAGISTSRNSGAMMMMMPPLLKSFTSDDGSFTLENVPVGAVNLVVNAPGYAAGRKGGLTLEEGKALSDIEVELEPGVKLVGRVTGPDGAPLAGAQVRLDTMSNIRVVPPSGSGRITTDASGEYVLDSLEPGEKTFEFVHSKYVTARKTVELKGTETRLDVRLEGGQRVTGSVVTDAGAAVPDANVDTYSSGTGRSARTDASGNFVFETLPAGRYTFRASKAGLAQGKVEDVDIQAGAPVRIVLGRGGVIYGHITGLAANDYANVTVDANGPAGQASAAVDSSGNYRIDGAPAGTVRVSATLMTRDYSSRKTSLPKSVQMEAGGSQQLDLEFRSDVVVHGRITRDGRPLSAATVTFMPRSRAQTMVATPADDQGMYTASGLEDGEYTVSVMDTQRISPYQTTYRVSGSSTFDIDYRTTTIRGRVVDAETGDPVVEAAVQLKPSDREGSFTGMRSAITDSNGSFAIDFMQAGTYVATAEKQGYGNVVRTVMITETSAPELDFRIARNDGILLTVVDARDGNPVAATARAVDAAGQSVYDPTFRGSGSTEPLRLPLGVGTFTVTVSAPGYADQTLTMQSPSQQRVALSRGGTIVVRSVESIPRRVRVRNPNGSVFTYGRFSRDSFPLDPTPGILNLPNMAPGTYKLEVLSDTGMVLKETQVTVVDNQTMTVDL